MAKKQKAPTLKARESHEMCYVCKRPIQKHPVYIGQELYRHIRCAPGSARWMRSDIGMLSEVREYFEVSGELIPDEKGGDENEEQDEADGEDLTAGRSTA